MAKVPLQKIRVTGLKQHYKILLQELHRKGVLQISENEKFETASTEPTEHSRFDAFDLARLDFAIKFLTPHAPKKGKLEGILTGGKLIMPEEEARKRFETFAPKVEEIVSECEKLEESMARFKNEIVSFTGKKLEISHFKKYKLVVGTSLDTEQTVSWVGAVPISKKEQFIQELAKTSHLMDLKCFADVGKQSYLRLTVLKSETAKMPEIFQRHGFVEKDLAADFIEFSNCTPLQIGEKLDEEIARFQSEQKKSENKIIELAKSVDDLKITRDFHAWRKDKNDAQHKVLRTSRVFAFEAWIPTFRLKKMEHWAQQTFLGDVTIEKISPEKNEAAPTLLQNRGGISSFQIITEMFGSPKDKEIDPTPGMAPFFVIFFGVCLSDTGYGLLLFLVSSLLLLFGKYSREARSTIWMIFMLGMSAFAGGVLLGGHFGMTAEQAPAFLTMLNDAGEIVFRGQILDPMKGTGAMSFLIFTFAVGIFQLLVGLVMQFVQNVHNKNYIAAFADSAAWFYFLVMLICFALADQFGLDKALFTKLAISGAGILVLTQGRSKKNIFAKLLFGVLGLYGVMDYVSNMLSYSRLMALGLATGIIGSAMNMTAVVLGEMLPGVLGILIMVLFLLFGHSINFGLSTLGAFIHTMRLQFIEFFGGFYGGGSAKFKPFARVKKYLLFRF